MVNKIGKLAEALSTNRSGAPAWRSTRQAVEAYNPTRVIGKDLSAKLREHFFKTREAFRRQIDEIPISSRSVRLRALDRMAVRFEDMGNLLGAMAALEQAAKEMGGAYAGRGGAVDLKPVAQRAAQPGGGRSRRDRPALHGG